MLKSKQECYKDILKFLNDNPDFVFLRDKEEWVGISANPDTDSADELWKVTIEFLKYTDETQQES